MRAIALIDIWLGMITAALIVFSTLHFLRFLYTLAPAAFLRSLTRPLEGLDSTSFEYGAI